MQVQLSNLTFNWFDLLVLVLIALGIFRGRKHGMSGELIPLLQWLSIVLVGAFTYERVGGLVKTTTGIDPTYCNVSVYLLSALLLKWAFTAITHLVGDKLLNADAFGGGEYYFGMLAGALRWLCILLFCLALFNAIYISDAQRAATAKMQQDNFGAISLPTLSGTQHDVFRKSASGMLVKQHLDILLIKPIPPVGGPAKETLRQQRDRKFDEMIK